MGIVVPDAGELVLLRRMLRPELADADTLLLQLYKNNYDPVKDSVLSNFTPCDFAGYLTFEMDPADWADPVTVAGAAITTWGASVVSFLASSGSQNVYGYFVTDHVGGTVLWAERFAGAPLVVTDTAPIVVLPVMQLHSELQPP